MSKQRPSSQHVVLRSVSMASVAALVLGCVAVRGAHAPEGVRVATSTLLFRDVEAQPTAQPTNGKIDDDVHAGAERGPIEVTATLKAEIAFRGEAALVAAEAQLKQELGAEASSFKRLANSKILILRVSQKGLAILERNADVDRVRKRRLMKAQLAHSAPLVGAGAVGALNADGEGYSIAVIDGPIRLDHPFYKDRIVDELCFAAQCPKKGSSHQQADVEHGTAVAGIALGRNGSASMEGQNRRLNGVAPGAKLLAINVFSERIDDPAGCAPSASPCSGVRPADMVAALEYVANHPELKVAAVNISVSDEDMIAELCDYDERAPAIEALRKLGIATVVASGNRFLYNYAPNVGRPACAPFAIAVSATGNKESDHDSERVAYFAQDSALVSFFAPGAPVWSSTGLGFGPDSGTSFAAPHVAGAIAGLRSLPSAPDLDQVLDALAQTGTVIHDNRRTGDIGRMDLYHPRINVGAAAEYLSPPPLVADVDGDGPLDLIFIGSDTRPPSSSPSDAPTAQRETPHLVISTARSKLNGTFEQWRADLDEPPTSRDRFAVAGQANFDKRSDLFFVDTVAGTPSTIRVRTKLSSGDGKWLPQPAEVLGPMPERLSAVFGGDVNGDKLTDLILVDEASNVRILYRKGAVWSAAVVESASFPRGRTRVFQGNFAGDERPDLLFASWDSTSLVLTVKTASKTGAWQTLPATTIPGLSLDLRTALPRTALINRDKLSDVLLFATDGVSVRTLAIFAKGNGAFEIPSPTPGQQPAPPGTILRVGFGDRNADGQLELALTMLQADGRRAVYFPERGPEPFSGARGGVFDYAVMANVDRTPGVEQLLVGWSRDNTISVEVAPPDNSEKFAKAGPARAALKTPTAPPPAE